ncbi:hypothetical protein [Prosthecobacter debontii]|nr:hypothetical protein [Prosthecobacter debontii]
MANIPTGKISKWRIGLAIFIVALVFSPIWFPVVYLISLVTVVGYTTPRSNTPFPEAHQRAINSFVESKGFGVNRLVNGSKYWGELSVHFEGSTHWKESICLLGLTPEYGDRYFTGRVPKKEALLEATHRPLTSEETAAVAKLRAGEPWVKLAVPPNPHEDTTDQVRVIAPLLAQQSCLECHQVKEGTLLGALDYLFHQSKNQTEDAEETSP